MLPFKRVRSALSTALLLGSAAYLTDQTFDVARAFNAGFSQEMYLHERVDSFLLEGRFAAEYDGNTLSIAGVVGDSIYAFVGKDSLEEYRASHVLGELSDSVPDRFSRAAYRALSTQILPDIPRDGMVYEYDFDIPKRSVGEIQI